MIEIAGLTKRFGDHLAVDDLSAQAPAGAVTAFLGPNGAGKTTTFRMLLGLVRPTAGRALIAGCSYAELEAPRETVGAVLESSGFHPARSGRDHLRVIATAAGFAAARVDELLAFVGLASAGRRRVGAYSTGMRQRLALAAALLGDPEVLVLDEPTSGLDPEGVAWVRRLLRRLAAEGRCVLLASHLLAEVVQVADRVLILDRGRLLRDAEIGELDGGGEVAIRVSEPEPLARALSAELGVVVSRRPDGALLIRGAPAHDVGRTAAEIGATVFELTPQQAGESLERLYLSLIQDGREGNEP